MMKTILALMASIASAAPALAQYYPPPGYDRPPPPPYGYDRPPPGYYPPPPPRYERPVRFGRHCDAVMRTPYGPRQVFCPIVEPKPLDESCACPPPPGYPPEPFIGGRTVR